MADPTKPDAPVTSTRSWLNACSRLIGSDPARASSARLDRAALPSQHLEHPRDNARGVEPGPGIHALGLVVVDEEVRQDERAHLEAAIEHAALGQQLEHEGAEAADRALLDRQKDLVLAREPQDQVFV